MRVLEILKRQLHNRLRHVRVESEAATFGLVICGTSVTCYRMQMDCSRGVCLYRQDESFVLPATYETHAHMNISLEAILQFKDRMLQSLPKDKADTHKDTIWNLQKPMIRPTVASFVPIYRDRNCQ